MRVFISSIMTIFLLGPFAAFADDGLSGDEAILREFKTELWQKAYRTQDTELLDRLLHDSFQMINGEGERSTKQDELERIRTTVWSPGNFEFRIERLDIYQGRFAVVDGTGVADKYTYKSSNFFVKEDGVWRAIASHVSGRKARDAAVSKLH